MDYTNENQVTNWTKSSALYGNNPELHYLTDSLKPPMLTDVQKNKIAHLFNVLDSNKNGQLQLDDFVEVSETIIKYLKLEYQSRQAQILLKKASRLFVQLLLDINEPEMSISFRDWMLFFEKEIEKEEQSGLLFYYVHRTNYHLFTLFDLNKDNFIQFEEYSNMLSVYKIPLHECRRSFDRLDQNKDDKISRNELIQGLDDFFRSPKEDVPGNWIFGEWR